MYLKMGGAISFLLLLAFLCNNAQTIIIIEDGGKPYSQMIDLSRNNVGAGIVILENTLSDTALLENIFHIPPGKIGSLGHWDCYGDSTLFTYLPYKATSGRLVLKYTSQGL